MNRQSVFRLLACTSAVLMCFAAGTAQARKAPAKHAAAEQAPAAQNVEVELVHALGDDKDAQLRKLVDRFNAQSNEGKIVVSTRAWNQGSLPAMTIVSEQDEDQFLDNKTRVKPVWQVMKDAKLAFGTGAPAKYVVPNMMDSGNRLRALPVALSTPVLFYNKDVLTKLGVTDANVPRTWRDWISVLGRFYTQGVRCPIAASQPEFTLYENGSIWNNQGLTKGGKTEQFAGNGLVQIKHVAMLASWRKSGYLYYYGRGNEADAHFTAGECGALIAPSGAYPSLVRQAGFQVGVAPYPYQDDAYGAPSHTIADGPALWVANGKSAAEYRVVAHFIQFFLQADNQAEWQANAGYLPLNRNGNFAGADATLLRNETPANRVAMAELTNRPTTESLLFAHRAGVRRILSEELEQIFDDKKPPKQGLDDAELRIRTNEAGCCRAR